MEISIFNITQKLGEEEVVELPNFLGDFINKKATEYLEDERKAAKNFEEKLESTKKFILALFVSLTNLSLKEIARVLSFNYGWVRKWNMRDDFKAEVERLKTLFVKELVELIKEKLKKGEEYPEIWNSVTFFSEGVIHKLEDEVDSAFHRIKEMFSDEWYRFVALDQLVQKSYGIWEIFNPMIMKELIYGIDKIGTRLLYQKPLRAQDRERLARELSVIYGFLHSNLEAWEAWDEKKDILYTRNRIGVWKDWRRFKKRGRPKN